MNATTSLLILLSVLVVTESDCPATEFTAADVKQLLDQKGSQLVDADLEKIGQAREVTTLDLSQCGRISDTGLQHLVGLTELRELKLTGCRKLTAEGLRHLQKLDSLESLSLERAGPSLGGLHHLAELPNLRTLDVSQNNTFRGEGLEQLQQLTSLNASCSRGAFNNRSLERLSVLTQLEHLNLNGCDQITDAGLPHLQSLTRLKSLQLYGCHKLTDKGFNSLFQNLVCNLSRF